MPSCKASPEVDRNRNSRGELAVGRLAGWEKGPKN